jgi:hypothetical protein
MNIKRNVAPAITFMALSLVLGLVSGCSQSAAPTAMGAPGTQPITTNAHVPMSASAVQTETQKIQSDPNTTSAEKQMMLRELNHAPTSTSN